jgi:hypothetical protein
MMKIVTMMSRPPAPVAASSVLVHAIAATTTGTAIASGRWSPDRSGLDVERIARLPAGLDPAVKWVTDEFPDFPSLGQGRSVQAVIDTDGLGEALWDRLFRYRHVRGWSRCDLRGRDRQALSNVLLVAMSNRMIRITDTTHESALRRALGELHRAVGEDGVVGAEMTTALALAVWSRPHPPVRVY